MTSKSDQYSEKETAARRDDALRRALTMVPKPHVEMKLGKSAKRKKAKPKRKI